MRSDPIAAALAAMTARGVDPDDTGRLDNLRFLTEHTDCDVPRAAARLGVSVDNLYQWCRRGGHMELYNRLAGRNPMADPTVPVRDTRRRSAANT